MTQLVFGSYNAMTLHKIHEAMLVIFMHVIICQQDLVEFDVLLLFNFCDS